MTFASKHGRVYRLAEPTVIDDALPSFDIIALHGLGGTWKKSWSSRHGYCWLSNALPAKYPNSRILSINHPTILQDLASSRVEVKGLIVDLIHERSSCNRSDHPIIFIGHSFGGNLLKQVFLATHPSYTQHGDYLQLHRCLRGYVYLGTSHRHPSFPDIPALWRTLEFDNDLMTLGGRSPDLANAILNIARINDEFRETKGEDLPSICFYETVKTRVGLSERLLVSDLNATLGSRTVEATPLDLRHQALGKFENANDNNLLRFLASFDRLMLVARDPDIRRIHGMETNDQRRGLNLLSLDGGGVKGLFTILVLQRLIEQVAHVEESRGQVPSRKRPCDYFDLIGGTSTGGLLAIMLGRLQMDTGACIRTYRALSKRVFSRYDRIPLVTPILNAASAVAGVPWFSGEKLKKAICDTIKENLNPRERESMLAGGHTVENLRLASTVEFQKCRCFVCAVPKGHHTAERIRSYRSIDPDARDSSTYTIWEAARATSAAPMYFPSITVQGQTYFDGGLDCNNPVMEVIKEARLEFPGSRIQTVVSIGTGSPKVTEPAPYLHNVLLNFAQRATDTEAPHQQVSKDDAFDHVRAGYYRFQGKFDLGEIDLADAERLDEIEKLTQQYLDSEEGKVAIESCAARLVGEMR